MLAPAITFDGDRMAIRFDQFGPDSYGLFLKAKALPESEIEFDREAETYTLSAPRRFAAMLGAQDPGREAGDLPLSPFLFDDQAAIVRMALDTKRFACWSDCGLGKGLQPECPVLTPGGFVPLSNLKVGDDVIGANGRPTRIIGYFPRGEQPLYRVTFSDGVSIVCDADHLWNVKSYNDVARGKPWRTMATRELAATQLKYGTHGQSRTWQIPLVAPVEFPPVEMPLDPYLLGVLLGDGSIGGTVSWCKPDREIADRIRPQLPLGVELVRSDSETRATLWRIVSRRGRLNPVLGTLRMLGLGDARSWEKFVPPCYMTACIEDRIALLQGLMDTDGYSGETPEFCSTSEKLATSVRQLVESLGGTATVALKESPQYEHRGEQRTGRTAYRVTMTLPAGINPFSLPRKATAYKTASRGLGRWIDSIEPCGTGETICIKVAADDGLFVIDRHVVTHNTLIALEFARHVMHRTGGRFLIVTMNDIVWQFVKECRHFYGDSLPIERIGSRQALREWCTGPGPALGITNYEKFNPDQGDIDTQVISELRHLAGIGLDESSRLKTGGGKQKWAIIKSSKGIEYKLSCTATPAPNDTMEFASQASFLERMRSEGDIIWTYFHRDQKTHRWTVKRHAREGFFRFMAGWSIYVRDPRKYGWRLDHKPIPEPIIEVREIEPTPEQLQAMRVYQTDPNGQMLLYEKENTNAIERVKLSEIAKGFVYAADKSVIRIPSLKPAAVAALVAGQLQANRRTLIWTQFDAETDLILEALLAIGITDAEVLTGRVPKRDRAPILDRFRSGKSRLLIGRAKMIGYGQNFQKCSAMIFSGWNDSYEEFYQALRRAYRHGQKRRLRVFIPVVRELEGDMLENILGKEAKHLASIEEMEANYIRALRQVGGAT